MTSEPPDVPSVTWKVKMGGSVAAYHQKFWYRGIAVSRTDQIFSVYLLDYGFFVHVKEEELRPLTVSLLDIPPFSIQVKTNSSNFPIQN